MVFPLLGLPLELIKIIILYDLSLSDLAILRLQNKLLYIIVDEVLRETYRKDAKIAGVVNVPLSLAPMLERLARLRRRERAWTHFQLDSSGRDIPETDIPINFENYHKVYEVADNYILLQCDCVDSFFLSHVPTFDDPRTLRYTPTWWQQAHEYFTQDGIMKRGAITFKLDRDLLAVVT